LNRPLPAVCFDEIAYLIIAAALKTGKSSLYGIEPGISLEAASDKAQGQ
jgi:hypothetical protein